MKPLRIFISSVQKELAIDRVALRNWLQSDPLIQRFFELFLFEDVPAQDHHAQEIYLDEAGSCDVYIGLLGNEYGDEDAEGISPTEHEFNQATQHHKSRLIFVKNSDDQNRHPKMRAFIQRIGNALIRRRYLTPPELIAGVYAALVQYLEEHEFIRMGPFDSAPCRRATLSDLDEDKIARFVRRAKKLRGFPLAEDSSTTDILTHLNLLAANRVTHAAILLFAQKPQRFLISSEIKCAHFHGTQVAKPIPSYQVYKGTVFDLVDQAVDFVLSKINLWVGTREVSTQVPIAYEIPREVVAEAIVNAVAHRDYTSNGSVQVMLFADRLEVWNPGTLPASLTIEKLRHPHGSVPHNPLLAEPLYLTKYIERMGTGTGDMIRHCKEVGLPEPQFTISDGFVTTIWRKSSKIAVVTGQETGQDTGQDTGHVDTWIRQVIIACGLKPLKSSEIQAITGIKHRETFQRNYLDRLLVDGLLERTIPDKPKSSQQKYRLTAQGRALKAELLKRKKP